MKIKICGLTRMCDIDYVNECKPDYVGFVFAPSKVQITENEARVLRKKVADDIKVVGVFVNDDIARVNHLVRENVIDLVQLHGHEDDLYVAKVKAPTIKAVCIGDNYERMADFILFDSPGGASGKTFDWSQLPRVEKPFFLAGGINLANLDEAIKLNPYAIDISSGVETAGVKDKEKLLAVVRRVRNA